MAIRLSLLILFCCLQYITHAQRLILLQTEEFNQFGSHIARMEDKTGSLTIRDILHSPDFQVSETNIGSSTPTLSVTWVKFQVKNLTQAQYFLEVENPALDKLELYAVDEEGRITTQKTGDLQPASSRQVSTNVFLFRLNLPSGKINTYYIRYAGTEGHELPLRIATPEVIIRKAHDRDLANGIYFGIVLVTVLYNLGIFLMVRDRSYLYYVLFVLNFGLLQAELLGLNLEYFWPGWLYFNTQSLFIFGGLAGVFSINFLRNFLETKFRAPGLHNVGYGIEALFFLTVLLAVFNTFLPSSFALFNAYLISFIVILFSPYMILVGITIFRQGFRPARFFLIAWSIFLVGLVIFILKSNGFIHHSLFTNAVMQIGSGIEAILLSLALGDRYNMIKKEKEDTQEELNHELMTEIKERIKAQDGLKSTNENLVKINTDLDNFVYTASHDLKAPIVNIEGLINDLKAHECYQNQDIKEVLDMMSISVERFKSTIYDLTEITKAQKNLEEDIDCIEIREVIDEIQLSIIHMIKQTGAEIKIELNECDTIMFSKKNFRSIMYNLISNAVKYRSPERKPLVKIIADDAENFIVIRVQDNGLGISDSHKDKVFSMFKRAHDHVEGTGVGLYIVKRVIENYGGRIELETTEGKGSEFKVYFRKITAHSHSK